MPRDRLWAARSRLFNQFAELGFGFSNRPFMCRHCLSLRAISSNIVTMTIIVKSRLLDDTYSSVRRSRSALPTTLTDDSAMAAAAITGDSRIPKIGKSTPAAIGTPAAL